MWTITYTTTRLVSRHRGTLPVILTCPHDGDDTPPGVTERTGAGLPAGCPSFSKSRDVRTREITTGIAQRLLEVFGEAPYVVIADFHRKFIDANRSAGCAYEDADAKPYYAEYHKTIGDFVNEVRAENGGLGLLFDIHGTGVIDTDPADLYLGTANGDTIARLLEVDSQAMWRRRSLRGYLTAAGYVVSPKQQAITETPAVNGGYTVRSYGSANPDGLNAIQLEVARPLRDDDGLLDQLTDSLAGAIGNLVDRYADTHTLAGIQSANLYGNEPDEPVVFSRNGWALQRRNSSNDWTLRLGGRAYNRGRVEVRHDVGQTGEFATPRRAGILVLYDENGNDHYLWIDNQGKLRVSPSDPGANSQAGQVIGTQE